MKVGLIDRILTSRRKRLKNLNSKIIQFLTQIPDDVISEEQLAVLNYLRNNKLAVFPYSFVDEYSSFEADVQFDKAVGLYYSMVEGKRLYYKSRSQKKARRYFKVMAIEQDKRSPHCYLSDSFNVNRNDYVVDIGAADGNFSLSIIDKASHVVLFEPDKSWLKALEATFAPWKEKVTIVNEFISDRSDQKIRTVSLDDFFNENQKINFIKADVEGFEIKLLHGAKRILTGNADLRIAVCTYHNQDDADRIENILSKHGFKCDYSPGYMLYYYGRSNVVKEPYLRRAILRATKSSAAQ